MTAPYKSLAHYFKSTVHERGESPAYSVYTDDQWHTSSWAEYGAQVDTAARAFYAHGLRPGDFIAILAYNRPKWTIAFHAALRIGAIPSGIYWTSSSQDVHYILHHSDAKFLIAEDAIQVAKVTPHLETLPALDKIITLEVVPDQTSNQVISWENFISQGNTIPADAIEPLTDNIKPEDLASLIYTSGTTGPPKAVALSHRAILAAANINISSFVSNVNERILSYLPLAHIAEQSNTLHQHVILGYHLYFVPDIEKLGTLLPTVNPTVFFAVPRVFEKISAVLKEKTAQASATKQRLFNWAQTIGLKVHMADINGTPAPFMSKLLYPLADKLVLSKVRRALGLNELRLTLSGAAPISVEVLEYFASLGIIICEIYGQSEICGPSTFNLPGSTRLGSVGKPPPGVSLKVAEDGEILVSGAHLFSGYYKDEAATAETMENGFLKSGDLGYVDEDGFVYINGRKKDLIITSGGKNISPSFLETDLVDCDLITHAIICGDNKNYLTALIFPDSEIMAARGINDATGTEAEKNIQLYIDGFNERHARVMNIRKFTLADKPLSIEAGELTATLKVKRANVMKNYADEIAEMYT